MSLRTPSSLLPAAVAVVAAFASLVVADAAHPPGSFGKYTEAARLPAAIALAREADFSPLYLATVRVLLPVAGERGLLALNTLLFAVACAAMAATVRGLAGGTWGLVAGLASALYRPLLAYCGVLEPEIAMAACLAVAVWAAARARERVTTVSTVGWAAVAAAVLACATLLRPQYVLLVPVWAAWVGAGRGRRQRRWIWAVSAAAAASVLLPVVVSRIASGAGAVIMNPGPVFYEGNNRQASGAGATAPELVKLVERSHPGEPDYAHVAYRRLAAAATGGDGSPARANAFWSELALAGMRAEPADAIRRFARKAVLALAPAEIHDVAVAELLDRRLRRILPFGFGALLTALPLAALASRRAMASVAGTAALALLSWTVQIAFYASARQRLPLAVALLIALPCLARDGWRQHGWRAATAALLLGAGFAATVAWAAAPSVVAHELNLDRDLGPPAASFGERAAGLLDGRGWRSGEREAMERVAAAGTLLERRRPEAARAVLGPVLDGALTASAEVRGRAEYYRARALLAAGDLPRAIGAARGAVALDANDPSAVALAAALSSTTAPVAPPPPPAGVDPLSWDFDFGREAAAVWGRPAGRRLVAPVLRVFPELERTAIPEAAPGVGSR